MCENKEKQCGVIPKLETEYFKFFQHKECEFFPCHKVKNEKDFNCLFCYCPLYALGDKCGGNFIYTDEGIKDCCDCLIPHNKDAYEHITSKCKELVEIAKKK